MYFTLDLNDLILSMVSQNVYSFKLWTASRPERGCSRVTIGLWDIMHSICTIDWRFNTLRPRQSGRHFADDIFECNFLNENVWLPIKISLTFVPKDSFNNSPALVQIMAWRRPGDKPLSETMMASLATHICVTRPQWINHFAWHYSDNACIYI